MLYLLNVFWMFLLPADKVSVFFPSFNTRSSWYGGFMFLKHFFTYIILPNLFYCVLKGT